MGASGASWGPMGLVRRDSRPGRPDTIRADDITFIPTAQGWLHFSTLPDMGSRCFIGKFMAEHARTSLVADTLDMAASAWGDRTVGTAFRSDRGSHDLSAENSAVLVRHGRRRSAGQPENR